MGCNSDIGEKKRRENCNMNQIRNDNFSKGILSIGKALINEVYI